MPGDNGVLLIQGLGRPLAKGEDGDGDDGKASGEGEGRESARSCELAPAFGEAVMRIVCAWTPRALSELGPWLTRTAPRSTTTADLHVDVRMKPLEPTIEEQKRLIGMILGSVVGAKMGLSSLRDLAVAFGTDMADFATDLDGMSADVTLGDGGAQAAFTLRLSGSTSTLGRIATAHPERTGPVPPAFWQLPGDSDFAVFSRGLDEAAIAKGRDLVLRIASDTLAEGGRQGAGPQGHRRRRHEARLDGACGVRERHRRGGRAQGRSPPRRRSRRRPARPSATETKRQTIEALLGWRVLGLDEPSARSQAALKELVGGPRQALGDGGLP